MKTIEQHLANLQRKGLAGDVEQDTMFVKRVLEVVGYGGERLVRGWLNAASQVPADEDRPATGFFTRFALYRDFRAEGSAADNGFEAVTNRAVLETGKVGVLWGIDWYANGIKDFEGTPLSEKNIVVTSVIKDDVRVYWFQIQDDETLRRVSVGEIV